MEAPRQLSAIALLALPFVSRAQEVCCEGLVAECLAYEASMSAFDYCAQFPGTAGCDDFSPTIVDEDRNDEEEPMMCCFAYNSECLSCADGVDEVTWCKTHKSFDGPGCDHASLTDGTTNSGDIVDEDPSVMCCDSMTPDCLACFQGLTTWDFCSRENWAIEGCEAFRWDVSDDILIPPAEDENDFPRPCCKAFTGECNACVAGETLGVYCQAHPNVVQCPEWLAFSKDSLAAEARARIDAWLNEAVGINEFGDEPEKMYLGGNPLFDETTGVMLDLYEYVALQHDDAPWMGEDSAETAGNGSPVVTNSNGDDAPVVLAVVGGVGGAVFAGAVLMVYTINRSKNRRLNSKGGKLEDIDDSDTDSAGDNNGDGNEMVKMDEVADRIVV